MLFMIITTIFAILGATTLLSYLLSISLQNYLLKDQDLKVKYKAEWALVTGGSSGIGLAFVEKLAKQGINVVIVALKDTHLEKTFTQIKLKYPLIKFKSVGCDLSSTNPDTYMLPISEATKDITISLVFNNAGYILVSLFNKTDVQRHIANYNCNATAAIYITHEYTRRMVDKKIPGLVVFTSSPGGFLPTPTTVMYAATKAFLTTFGASLAGELKDDKIDVVVVHPSPIASNFYSNTALLDTVNAFQKQAVSPSVVADLVSRCAGRLVIADQGAITVIMRCVTKVVDWNLFTILMTQIGRFQPDYKRVKASHLKRMT